MTAEIHTHQHVYVVISETGEVVSFPPFTGSLNDSSLNQLVNMVNNNNDSSTLVPITNSTIGGGEDGGNISEDPSGIVMKLSTQNMWLITKPKDKSSNWYMFFFLIWGPVWLILPMFRVPDFINTQEILVAMEFSIVTKSPMAKQPTLLMWLILNLIAVIVMKLVVFF